MTDAADFYLNKVLVDAKKSGKEEVGKFATSFKALLQSLATFVQQNYATGLEWNPKVSKTNSRSNIRTRSKRVHRGCAVYPMCSFHCLSLACCSIVQGGDLKSFSAGSSSSSVPAAPAGVPAAPGAPAPPPGPPGAPSSFAPAPAKTTSGMGAVFGELNAKGDGVTGGLKKVTADMKSKNIKAPVLEPTRPAAAAAASSKKAAVPEVKREPKTYLSKGTWFVEHHEGNSEIVLDEVQLKENVYILKCKDSVIRIPNKCKSIQVDNCHKTSVVFTSIVSVFEIFNSQRVKIECEDTVPSIAVDKSAGVSVTLSRSAVAVPPTLITSSITEMNLVIPGATDEDDPIEIPLPEQYETKLVDGKLHTEAVSHSGN
jgi:adenylyl cyclase-associated protein